MKIGLIGLGDIARKAYLPVFSEREDIELILCTRNVDTLDKLSARYKVKEKVQTVEELMKKGIDAAFVSTASNAHYEITEKLLKNGIHVYIDKPITMNINESSRIVELAKAGGNIAMVGFNRRFIPMVKSLKEKGKANMIIMQKNRFKAPDYIRTFVVQDFIHVVDTLRFLMDTPVKDIKIQYDRNGELLNNLIVQLIGEGCTAIGIMNKNTGVTEEIIEYMTAEDKYVINNLVETTKYHNKEVSIDKFGDWDPTLYKRGFYQIVEHFINCVKNNRLPEPAIEDSLITHELCERIVKHIASEL
jgi:virulence factor